MTAKVSDYMQAEVATVGPSDSLAQLQELLTNRRIGGAPVVDGDKLVGVASRADLLRALAEEASEAELIADYYQDAGWPRAAAGHFGELESDQLHKRKVSEVMSTRLLTVAPNAAIGKAAQLMLEHQVHRLPVTKGDSLVGIITSQDVLRAIAE